MYKKNRTDKYDFLCELCEQEHHISSARFFFFLEAVIDLCMASNSRYRSNHKTCPHYAMLLTVLYL